jgi:hypothetical protein
MKSIDNGGIATYLRKVFVTLFALVEGQIGQLVLML